MILEILIAILCLCICFTKFDAINLYKDILIIISNYSAANISIYQQLSAIGLHSCHSPPILGMAQLALMSKCAIDIPRTFVQYDIPRENYALFKYVAANLTKFPLKYHYSLRILRFLNTFQIVLLPITIHI